MKQNIRKMDYKVKEALAYYILAERISKKQNKGKDCLTIIRNLLLTAGNVDKKVAVSKVNIELLDKIDFFWTITADEFVAYATCIFYVLTKREKEITEEMITKEFFTELHSHHPRRIMKEAEFILEEFFPDIKY